MPTSAQLGWLCTLISLHGMLEAPAVTARPTKSLGNSSYILFDVPTHLLAVFASGFRLRHFFIPSMSPCSVRLRLGPHGQGLELGPVRPDTSMMLYSFPQSCRSLGTCNSYSRTSRQAGYYKSAWLRLVGISPLQWRRLWQAGPATRIHPLPPPSSTPQQAQFYDQDKHGCAEQRPEGK